MESGPVRRVGHRGYRGPQRRHAAPQAWRQHGWHGYFQGCRRPRANDCCCDQRPLYLPGHSAGELDRALRISGGRSSRREIGTGKSACGYDSPATPIMRAHPDSLAFALRHGKRPPVPRQKHDPVLDLLTSSAFIRTDQRARLNRKLGKELGCHLHRKFLETRALQPREYSCSFVFDRKISSCRLWPEVILCMTGHEPA